MTKATFGDVLIFTDKPEAFEPLEQVCKPHFITVPDFPSKLEWVQFYWYGTTPHVRTPIIMTVDWDSGIWDPTVWRPEFASYDFIGAPWPWHPNRKVGNSGFSLKSTRLARYLRSHQWEFPCNTEIEDDLLCRKYRPQLEERGFTWAPEKVAYDFSYEGCGSNAGPTRHFGYHANQNFKYVFTQEQVIERGRFMLESIATDSYIWQNFANANPDIVRLLQKEAEDVVGNQVLSLNQRRN